MSGPRGVTVGTTVSGDPMRWRNVVKALGKACKKKKAHKRDKGSSNGKSREKKKMRSS